MTDPAPPISIRTKNPGAMWGGARANKWGATADIMTGDKEGNHIAVFPTFVDGAAAQFDLWRSNYTGLTLGSAIKKWSGGNSSPPYANFLVARTAILTTDTITTQLLAGPKGIALMKAQAAWESGKIKDGYPMTDTEWQQAQAMVFKGAIPPPPDIPKAKPSNPAPTKSVWGVFFSALVSIFKRKT